MAPTNNQFLNFVAELIKRFATKSPKFFKVLQIILGAVTAVTGLPELLTWLSIPLPAWMTYLSNSGVAWATLSAFLMALLPADTPVVAQTQDGTQLKATNEAKLPFTAKAEEKAEEKKPTDVPTVK